MKTRALYVCLLVIALSAFAQGQATGFPPYGSFEAARFDAINRQNLNVNIAFPIASYPGRGTDFQFAVVYDSAIWLNGGTTWFPSPNWGWKNDKVTGTTTFQALTRVCIYTDPGDGQFYTEETTRYKSYVYTDRAGTRHSFSVDFHLEATHCNYNTGPVTGFATDGSGYYLDAGAPDSPTVTDTGGNQIGVTGTFTDTNGNRITKVVVSSSETDWTDTRGVVVLQIITGTDSIQYKTRDQNGAYQTTTLNLASVNIKTNFGCSGVVEYTGTGSLPTSLVLPNGRSYSFSYEATPGFSGYVTGRLAQVTLPTGGSYQYQYAAPNDGINCADGTTKNLTRIISDGTSSATWHFVRTQSGSNWNATVTAPQLPYDAAANEATYTFNSSGQLTSTKIYQGSSTSGTLKRTVNTTWAANGSPASQTVILENNQQSKVDTTFDTYGNPTQVIEYGLGSGAPGAAMRTTALTYLSTSAYTSRNIRNRVTQQLVRSGGATGTIKSRTNVAYDGTSLTCVTGAAQHDDAGHGCAFTTRGNPTSVTTYTNAATPSGGITKNFYYDSLGNLHTADLNCCQQKQWNYSATTQYAFPDSVVSGPAGGPQLATSATYDQDTGHIATATDENGKVTTFTYDTATWRPTNVQRPDGANISYSYDDTARTVSVFIPIQGTNELQRTTYFDALGRAFKETVSDGATTYSISESQYDPLSRAYKAATPHNSTAQYWTETRFDALGRPTVVIPPDGSPTSNNTSYSYSGNTVTITDPAGKQRKQQGDALGRLEIAFEPDVANGNQLTQQTSYAYNVLDALTTVTQGAQTRSYVYDDAGSLTSAATPEAGTVSYLYNNFNQVTQRTDARGVISSYTYDGLNRPYQVSYNVGATGVPATSIVTYTYGTSSASNNNGRLLTVADGSNTETYSYDGLGQVTQTQKLISGTTYTVGYAYNLAGELTSITYPSGRVVQQNYDAIGRLTTILSGATNYASSFSYNPAGQVTGFSYGNGVTATYGYTPERLLLQSLSYVKTGQTLFSLSYGYTQPNGGKNGQITNITDNLDSGRTANYTYDALYRVSTAVTTGSASYPQWGLSWTYDRYGNRTNQTVTAGTAPSNSLTISTTTNRITNSGFTYDANGNLTQEGSASLQYKYDGENRLVSFNNGTASYTYVGALRVKKVSGSTTTVYVFSGSKVIAEYVNSALSKEYIYGGSALLATYEGATLKYHQQDHLSVRLTTDTAGTVLAQQGHYPFGEQWYAGAGSTKWKFTSYERDAESGLDQAIFRYDSTRVGRFTSPDPLAGSIGDPQSLNRYTYVRNDPVNLSDPLGLIPFAACATDGACVPLWGGGGGGSRYWDILNPNANAAFGTWIPGWVSSFTQTDTGESTGYYTWMYYPDPFSGGGGGKGGDQFAEDKQVAIDKLKADCAKFIEGVLKALDSGKSLKDFAANLRNATIVRGGSGDAGDVAVTTGNTITVFDDYFKEPDVGVILLHEGFHLKSTGKFGHRDLARAAKAKYKSVPENPKATDFAASKAFQDKLQEACGEKP